MTRQELERKTIAALRTLAKAEGVRLRPTLKKKEIVALLAKAFEAKATGQGRTEAANVHSAPLTPRPADIPREYGSNQIIALVRDPFWLYVYWEVLPETLGEANRRLGDSDPGRVGLAEARLTLRLYDMQDGALDVAEVADSPSQVQVSHFWDIEIFERIGNWYIHSGRPDRTYRVDIGVKSPAGLFATIARSNIVHTPPDAPSSRLDEEWWTITYKGAGTGEDFERTATGAFDEGRRLPLDQMEREAQALLASPLFSMRVPIR